MAKAFRVQIAGVGNRLANPSIQGVVGEGGDAYILNGVDACDARQPIEGVVPVLVRPVVGEIAGREFDSIHDTDGAKRHVFDF